MEGEKTRGKDGPDAGNLFGVEVRIGIVPLHCEKESEDGM